MNEKVLIVLQENSGRVPLPETVPNALEPIIYSVIDSLAETFEDVKTTLQADGKYKFVVLLTDAACKRKRLLEELVEHSKKKRVIDLIVLGHGANEKLCLNGENLTGGPSGNIRKLRADAKKKGCAKINLRLVYMCNCYASTLNDDWIYIGADVSIGSVRNDYMPEPMTTFFVHNWLSGQRAKDAAKNAYEATIPFYTSIYLPTVIQKYKNEKVKYPCGVQGFPPQVKYCTKTVKVSNGVKYKANPKISDTKLRVSGDANCKF